MDSFGAVLVLYPHGLVQHQTSVKEVKGYDGPERYLSLLGSGNPAKLSFFVFLRVSSSLRGRPLVHGLFSVQRDSDGRFCG